MNIAEQAKAKTNKMTVVLIVLVVILIAVIGVVGYLVLNKQEAPAVSPQGPAYDPNVLVGMSKDEMEALLEQQKKLAAENNVIVSMPSILTFQNGGETGKINIENVKENKFPFTVTLILTESGKQVLETGLIPPGSFLETATLSEKLPAGDYEASAVYTNFEADTGLERGKVGVAITIRIES